jgi:CRP-like cAMP-binding protein
VVICPDCPAVPHRVFLDLVDRKDEGCAFQCASVVPRERLPRRWFTAYGGALVRRGFLVRQRSIGGRVTAVDVVGAGGFLPLADGSPGASAYALSEALLCLCPAAVMREARGDMIQAQAWVIDRVERIAAARARPKAAGKVAALLCALSETLSPPRALEVIPTDIQQRDMATLLAMRPESVCRALGELERGGAVARGPEGTRIVDRARLAAA